MSYMGPPNDWYEPDHLIDEMCECCTDQNMSLDHASDHLMGLQEAMIKGNQQDILFHLQEICHATATDYVMGESNE
jgi:hypothetical protein